MEDEECYQVDIIDELVQQYTPKVLKAEEIETQEEAIVGRKETQNGKEEKMWLLYLFFLYFMCDFVSHFG